MFDLPENLLNNPFGADQKQGLCAALLSLTHDHCKACPAYNKIIKSAFPSFNKAQTLEDLPYLPVSLFKQRNLRSVSEDEVRFNIQSSGTTGSKKSQVALNKETAQLSSKALNSILSDTIGKKRKPMLYIDTKSSLSNRGDMGARASAILGLMPFGHNHCFVLDDNLHIQKDKLDSFLEKYQGQEILIYGFTSLIWESLLPYCSENDINLSNATLLHSGGWKHLNQQNISNKAFKQTLQKHSGINKIINFYGMAEMPGIIFPENEHGSLSVPNFSAVLIRDPISFEVCPDGKEGLVQIFNPLAHSYPGHSLLTEDIGVKDNTGLHILGRAPKAELRGCSDVIAAA